MGTDFDPLDDIFAHEAVKNVRAVGKFQPKAKFRPAKKVSAATSVSASQAVQTIDSTQSELSEPVGTAKPLDHCSDVVPNDNGGWHAFMEKSIGESSDVFTGLEVLGDFIPRTSSDMECTLPPSEPIVPSSYGRDNMNDREFVSEEMDAMDSVNNAEKDSTPTFQEDDVLDLSSLDFTHTLPTERPSNEESMNFMEGVRDIPTKLASRRPKTRSSNTHTTSDQQEASPSSWENEMGRTLRPRKSKANFCDLVDEDEVLTSVEFSEECPIEEENIHNEEFQVESESKMKKLKRKSKKSDDDKEKPVRKRKKVNEALDQDAVAKPKKFSHSTRRRRVVDRVLLETPEDEIDYNRVPLRDLIARADHMEKQMKKGEPAAGAPVTKQSNDNSSGLYNEDETFISKQGGEYNDEQEQGSPIAEDTTEYFNYQTYMDKTPSTRWSKQDTELFYEAVRQLGTDLEMIQQLFPGRTRRQVKLKYKKEEREHPMRLRDALTNRTEDHSHYKKLIEYLKQKAAEERNADKDDLIDLSGNEVADEGTSNADDEEPKDEHIQEEENNDVVANDITEGQSPLKFDDGEDDLFNWSQYKSDT